MMMPWMATETYKKYGRSEGVGGRMPMHGSHLHCPYLVISFCHKALLQAYRRCKEQVRNF